MKGFRKGQVPLGMIKKMYGNNILAEELDKILQDELYSYLQSEKINFLGRPIPIEGENPAVELAKENDYNFSFELGLSPEFEVSGTGNAFTDYVVKVDDETLNSEIDKVRQQYGKMTHPESIAEGDVLKVIFTEVDGKGNPIEEGVESNTHIDTKMISDDTAKKDILGMKKGDAIELELFKAFDKRPEEIAKHILHVDEARLETMGTRFQMQLEEINHLGLADIDQALFDKAFGKDEIKSEEEMRSKMTEIIEHNFKHSAKSQLRSDIRESLLDSTQIPLPDEFLKKFIKLNNQEPEKQDQIEDGYDNFSKDLRWTLIRNKLARNSDIKVEMDEVQAYARKDMEQRMQYYGYGQIPEEQLRDIVNNSLKDKDYSDRVFSIVLEDKVFGEMLEKVELKEQEISIADFNKLNESKNA